MGNMDRKKKVVTTHIKRGLNKESKLTDLPSNKLTPLQSGGGGGGENQIKKLKKTQNIQVYTASRLKTLLILPLLWKI
jgi:hypothetical protein